MDITAVTDRLRALGVTIPTGTLRRWAAEGLISAPTRTQNPHGRGRLSDWPEPVVEEAAACWALRHLNTTWAVPSNDNIKRVRSLAHKLYETPTDILTAVVRPDGTRGVCFFSYELHPLIVLWATTVEKARHGWPILKPACVTFEWTIEGTPLEGTLKTTLVRVRLEESDDGSNWLQVHSERIDLPSRAGSNT
ncbi:MAG: MerR family transcriptional regulator [Halobacteriota archaeon]